MTHDLRPFCDTDDEDGRYNLTTPWVFNGWQYASDGRIGVREPCTFADTPFQVSAGDKKRPTIEYLFEQFPSCTQPWPAHDGEKVKRKCPVCKGEEDVTCNCPKCGKDHLGPCQNCEDGTVLVPKPLIIAGRKIAGEYCLKIQAWGDVLYCPDGQPDKSLAFVCGELQGLVHPLTQK